MSKNISAKEIELFKKVIQKDTASLKKLYKQLFLGLVDLVSFSVFKEAIQNNDLQKILLLLEESAAVQTFRSNVQKVLFTSAIVYGLRQKEYLIELFKDFKVETYSKENLTFLGTLINEKLLKMSKNITAKTYAVVRDILVEARQNGWTLRVVIKKLQTHIPLTQIQSTALRKYEQIIRKKGERAKAVLENPNATRKMIERAKKNSQKLERVDGLVAKKSKQMTVVRAERIARTDASNFSNEIKYKQYIDVENEDRESVYRKKWIAIGDDRTREHHVELERKYSVRGIGLTEFFYGNYGPILHPSHERGHLKDVINCRCTMIIEKI